MSICRPTFQFYQGGNKIAEMKGANPRGLEDLVKQHQGDPNMDPVSSVGVSGHVSERSSRDSCMPMIIYTHRATSRTSRNSSH
jgi:hypothetical protein